MDQAAGCPEGCDEDEEAGAGARLGEAGESRAQAPDAAPPSRGEVGGGDEGPWPTIGANVGLGTMTEAGLDLLIEHARGVDRRLGCHRVVPGPHHVPGTWTIPPTMQLALRSSESWPKTPTAVPFVQNNLTEHSPDAPHLLIAHRSSSSDEGHLGRQRGGLLRVPADAGRHAHHPRAPARMSLWFAGDCRFRSMHDRWPWGPSRRSWRLGASLPRRNHPGSREVPLGPRPRDKFHSLSSDHIG